MCIACPNPGCLYIYVHTYTNALFYFCVNFRLYNLVLLLHLWNTSNITKTRNVCVSSLWLRVLPGCEIRLWWCFCFVLCSYLTYLYILHSFIRLTYISFEVYACACFFFCQIWKEGWRAITHNNKMNNMC